MLPMEKNCPESAHIVMLQCVLKGMAQEAYLSLSSSDCQTYSTIKSAALKAYELVPELVLAKVPKVEGRQEPDAP